VTATPIASTAGFAVCKRSYTTFAEIDKRNTQWLGKQANNVQIAVVETTATATT